MICPDPVEDQEAAASAAEARAAVASVAEAVALAAEAALAEVAHAEEASEADLEVTTDRRITDRPIFTARILAGAGTDRAITAAVAEAVSARF